MKVIKIFFLSLLALGLVLGMVIFIFFQTYDTDRYLPLISSKIAAAIGRPAFVGHVGLGISSRGITLDAWPLIVDDDPNFTKQPFIKIDRIRINLDLRSLVLKREVHITRILLQSPQIHFLRSQEGNFNITTLRKTNPSGNGVKTVEIAGIVQAPKNETTSQSAPNALGAFSSGGFKINSLKVEDAAISFIDQARDLPLDIWLSNINATLNELAIDRPFRFEFRGALLSKNLNVQGSALIFWDASKRLLSISDLSLHVDLSHLDFEELKAISPDFEDNPYIHDINGNMQLNVSRLMIDPSGDLQADGKIIVSDVVIQDLNLIKIILSQALGSFSGMDGFVDKLGSKDTVIKKAEAGFSFHDKTIFIDHSSIQTNIFEFTAKGSIDQHLHVDLDTGLHLNEDISTNLVNQMDGLKFLRDDTNRISIGASLKGDYPRLKYKTNKDFRKKSKKMFMEEGGSIISALLGGMK